MRVPRLAALGCQDDALTRNFSNDIELEVEHTARYME